MFKQMLKNQTTIAHSIEDCQKFSPFVLWYNEKSQRYVVSRKTDAGMSPVAAGMDKEEGEACLMVKANQFILNNMRNHA